MDGIEIRVTAPDEYRAAAATLSAALLHSPAEDEEWNKPARFESWVESDSLSAWEGDRCVGHVSGFRFDTLVPGGAWLPTSGVTRVGVLSTHRRRGVMRGLLNRLLGEALDRGQVLASLRASETQIYQRFGFGLAGRVAEVTVTPRNAMPITGAAIGGSMRLLRPDEVLPTAIDIYDRVARRPGVLRRPTWMWQRFLEKTIDLGGDAEYLAVHTSAHGVDDGFVNYGLKWNETRWSPPRGMGEVFELWGATPAVELALWDYLCQVDLVEEWLTDERPTDDVVQFAVADTRAYQPKALYDEQWLRLLDVDAALASRHYNDIDGAVTIGVADTLLPVNSGVWSVSAAGAKRLGDHTEPDLAADVRELAAAYLGGTPWRSLVAAGRVAVLDATAVGRADALFAVPEAPFCGSGF